MDRRLLIRRYQERRWSHCNQKRASKQLNQLGQDCCPNAEVLTTDNSTKTQVANPGTLWGIPYASIISIHVLFQVRDITCPLWKKVVPWLFSAGTPWPALPSGPRRGRNPCTVPQVAGWRNQWVCSGKMGIYDSLPTTIGTPQQIVGIKARMRIWQQIVGAYIWGYYSPTIMWRLTQKERKCPIKPIFWSTSPQMWESPGCHFNSYAHRDMSNWCELCVFNPGWQFFLGMCWSTLKTPTDVHVCCWFPLTFSSASVLRHHRWCEIRPTSVGDGWECSGQKFWATESCGCGSHLGWCQWWCLIWT